MRLRSDLALLPLDGDAIAFSEETQQLVGLNRTAALLVEMLQNGVRVSELAHVFASAGLAPPDEAEQWVAAALDALRSCGILEDGPAAPIAANPIAEEDATAGRQAAECAPYRPFAPAAERRYPMPTISCFTSMPASSEPVRAVFFCPPPREAANPR